MLRHSSDRKESCISNSSAERSTPFCSYRMLSIRATPIERPNFTWASRNLAKLSLRVWILRYKAYSRETHEISFRRDGLLIGSIRSSRSAKIAYREWCLLRCMQSWKGWVGIRAKVNCPGAVETIESESRFSNNLFFKDLDSDFSMGFFSPKDRNISMDTTLKCWSEESTKIFS